MKFEEFEDRLNQVIFTSATPSDYEKEHSTVVAEQVIRPTGLLDPKITIKPTENQIDDLIGEINKRTEQGFRTLVTTLTKRMAEDLTDYLTGVGIKVRYMHSDISTIERAEIIKDLRMGEFDVLVGINLLREGLDIPEVALVAILDADKEGFLRSEMSLIQTIGRAARNSEGQVIMYADTVTKSMKKAIDETDRRRGIQQKFNEEHGIIPKTIKKDIRDIIESLKPIEDDTETAEENIILPLSSFLTEEKARRIAQKHLQEMEMEPFGNRYPKELSYGQQQRIAIARALAYPSPLLLMDEPFKGLDEALSHRIIERIREKQMKEERIILFTSHNPDEIRLLADEVIYL